MRIERITSLTELDNSRPLWEEVLQAVKPDNTFLSYEWFSCWSRYFSTTGELEILVLFDPNNIPVAIAPLLRSDSRLCFLADREVTDYCDFIFPAERAETLLREILGFITKELPEINSLQLINIPESSPTLKHLIGLAPDLGLSVFKQVSEVAPILDLPGTYAEFLAGLSRKNRHELRRKLKKYDLLTDIKVTTFTSPKKIRTEMAAFIELHKLCGRDKSIFWEKPGMPDFFRDIAFELAKDGRAELNLLILKEDLLAAQFNFIEDEKILLYNTAFATEYAELSPGIYLFDFRIKKAIAEKRKKMDFLRGREKYKYYFGAQDSKIFDLTVQFNR